LIGNALANSIGNAYHEGMKALEVAIKSFGSQAALASALGIRQPSVSEWLRTRVPAERCPEIERGTRERNAHDPSRPIVTCEQLRPDVAWEVVRGAPAADPQPAAQEG